MLIFLEIEVMTAQQLDLAFQVFFTHSKLESGIASHYFQPAFREIFHVRRGLYHLRPYLSVLTVLPCEIRWPTECSFAFLGVGSSLFIIMMCGWV